MGERERLGDILVRAAVITPEQLADGLARQATAGVKKRLGEIVVAAGFVTEEQLANALAEQLGLPFADLSTMHIDEDVAKLIPRRLADAYLVMPLERTADGALVVAMADPTNVVAADDIRVATGAPEIRPVVTTATALRAALERAYPLESRVGEEMLGGPASGAEIEMLPDARAEEDLDTIRKATETAPIVRLVNAIYVDAVKARATDIHIEPQPMDLRVRYRVDGVLREAITLPKRVQGPVLSRIKILSGMDIAERRRPQDGRGRIKVSGRQIDTRVSTIPTLTGEKAVIRLLPKGDEFFGIDSIGMLPDQLATLERYITMPQGLILFTGPTGSGKTTSMYAALQRLRGPDKNIVTLEDPVEYQMSWVNQMQIDERTGMTFARGLRAILRQDPNVVLVGEIRDGETARIALQAAMTGHLVLSTIHTNDAPSAVVRLIDIGVEPYLVSSALSLVVAQRLVRRVCDRCASDVSPSEEQLQAAGISAADIDGATIRAGAGCEACGGTGYVGRRGVHEVLPATTAIREMIAAGASEGSIAAAARAAGMQTLRSVAMQRATEGETSINEVIRVTAFDADDSPRCPGCRTELDPGWKSCPYCLTHVGSRDCGTCGRTAQAGWSGCPYCGSLLDERPPAAGHQPTGGVRPIKKGRVSPPAKAVVN